MFVVLVNGSHELIVLGRVYISLHLKKLVLIIIDV